MRRLPSMLYVVITTYVSSLRTLCVVLLSLLLLLSLLVLLIMQHVIRPSCARCVRTSRPHDIATCGERARYVCIYIYIYIERERDTHVTYTHTFMHAIYIYIYPADAGCRLEDARHPRRSGASVCNNNNNNDIKVAEPGWELRNPRGAITIIYYYYSLHYYYTLLLLLIILLLLSVLP